MTASAIPVAVVLTSLLPGLVIFFLPEEQRRTRTGLNLLGAVSKVGLIALLIPLVVGGADLEWRHELMPGIDLLLRAEPLSLYFVALSAVLWLATTVYAVGYLEDEPHRSRFFGFLGICVTAATGIALAGNLVTFLLFFELLTLSTYPLVTHRGTRDAMAGGRTYLAYTLSGGMALLLGVAWLTSLVGPVEFTPGGVAQVAELAAEQPGTARAIFAVLIAGVGVKAALVPLHSWPPKAMIAPAPVSALLHAVAVVKAGVYGVIRVVHHVFGVQLADGLGVLAPLAAIAAVTIVYGSLRALSEDDLKRRLAWSTVSQLSYITLGAAVVGVGATAGGVVHLAHQGLMKITLFFCAGVIAEVLHLKKVSELPGVGRRMPLTGAAFTLAAFGMIGLPPMAGFVSKWQLGTGAIEAGSAWVVVVLGVSAALNAAYFLPPVYAMWFQHPDEGAEWHQEERRRRRHLEGPASLVLPTVFTAVLALAAGLLAGLPYSPLELARIIAEGSYPT